MFFIEAEHDKNLSERQKLGTIVQYVTSNKN